MKLIPVITEKSMALAGIGTYTFLVDKNMNKYQIKELVEKTFSVHVTSVKTLNSKTEVKKTYSGRKKTVKGGKKTLVTLKDKEKIDLFEEKKEKKGKKKK